MTERPPRARRIDVTVRHGVAALVVALAVLSPAASATSLAHVWIASDQPLVVRGTGFHSTARISVVVAKVKHTYRSATMSGRAGGFTMRFKTNLPTACGNTVVTATDAAGRKAVSRIVANDCGGIRHPTPGA